MVGGWRWWRWRQLWGSDGRGAGVGGVGAAVQISRNNPYNVVSQVS